MRIWNVQQDLISLLVEIGELVEGTVLWECCHARSQLGVSATQLSYTPFCHSRCLSTEIKIYQEGLDFEQGVAVQVQLLTQAQRGAGSFLNEAFLRRHPRRREADRGALSYLDVYTA